MGDNKIRDNKQSKEEIKMRQIVSFCFSEVERLYPNKSAEEKKEIVRKVVMEYTTKKLYEGFA